MEENSGKTQEDGKAWLLDDTAEAEQEKKNTVQHTIDINHFSLHFIRNTRVVRKIRFPMIFHNEKHVYWH
jgi:hypothetical protein